MSSVFISYSRNDSKVADDLASILSEVGIDYFRDVKDIDWGARFSSRVREGLADCVAVLVIVSAEGLKSQWVPYEIGQASAFGKIVLPYLTDLSVEIPQYVRDLNIVTTVAQVREYFETSFPQQAKRAEPIHGESVYTTRQIGAIMELVVADAKLPMLFISNDLEVVLACNQQLADLLGKSRAKIRSESVEWVVDHVINLAPKGHKPGFRRHQKEMGERFANDEQDYDFEDEYLDCSGHQSNNPLRGKWKVRIHAHRVRHDGKPLGFFVYYVLDRVQKIPVPSS
ncbi:hypothetical protein RMSM_01447 [Rhodopirellula maiorica SM1]|uniref:TIR domain-containing protein n=1 Tax=Rhodopirellula maiorica SM1 TaxID=1265738 RepID=M5RQP8_9BACT|nr:toll/interleukin-1 receptor domain-containing protein [Rhodopirellula maiorica]EMI21620.1 hypothetical protein RMSM_01447 [Rhodopirellula maiorica SM1]